MFFLSTIQYPSVLLLVPLHRLRQLNCPNLHSNTVPLPCSHMSPPPPHLLISRLTTESSRLEAEAESPFGTIREVAIWDEQLPSPEFSRWVRYLKIPSKMQTHAQPQSVQSSTSPLRRLLAGDIVRCTAASQNNGQFLVHDSIMCNRFCVHSVVQVRFVDVVNKAVFLQKVTRVELNRNAFSNSKCGTGLISWNTVYQTEFLHA